MNSLRLDRILSGKCCPTPDAVGILRGQWVEWECLGCGLTARDKYNERDYPAEIEEFEDDE